MRASGADLKRRERAVQGVLDHVAHEVAGLSRVDRATLGVTLREARNELEKDLRRFLGTVNGDQKFTAQLYRNALVQIRGALAAIGHLEPGLVAILNKGTDDAGALAVKHIQYELAAFSKLFEESIRPIPLLPVNAIITQAGRRAQIARNRRSARRYAGAVGMDLRRQLAIGLIRGENVRQMVARLVGPGSKLKLGKIDILPQAAGLISDRLFRKFTYWAERIVRTEVITAYNNAADDSISALHDIDPRIGRMWNAANDLRVCIACHELDRTTADVGGLFPGGIDGAPLHPMCRCAICAWRSDWPELRGKP